MTFGELLREIRTRSRLSQAVVAHRAGLTQHYVNNLEWDTPGERPHPSEVSALAQATHATVSDTEALLRAAGQLGEDQPLISRTLEMIDTDPLLTTAQKVILSSIYRSWFHQ